MNASNLLIVILVIDAVLFFGMGPVSNELTGSTAPYLMSNGSLWLSFQNYTENSTDYTTNTTAVDDYTDWGSAAAIAVLDTTGVWNIAQPMFSFLNFLIGFITAPITFMELSGLNAATGGITSILGYAMVLLMLLAVWKIVTGRDT